MKSVSMSWAMSAVIAVCMTPGLRSLTPHIAAPHPTALAQADGSVAVPGSADAQGPAGGADDDGDYQAGQAQAPDDPDAAQQPPADMQQPPAEDNGDDTSTQPQTGDDADQGAAPAAPSPGGDDEN